MTSNGRLEKKQTSPGYERIEEYKVKFRQMRNWLLNGDADDMAACLALIDAALDERVEH